MQFFSLRFLVLSVHYWLGYLRAQTFTEPSEGGRRLLEFVWWRCTRWHTLTNDTHNVKSRFDFTKVKQSPWPQLSTRLHHPEKMGGACDKRITQIKLMGKELKYLPFQNPLTIQLFIILQYIKYIHRHTCYLSFKTSLWHINSTFSQTYTSY